MNEYQLLFGSKDDEYDDELFLYEYMRSYKIWKEWRETLIEHNRKELCKG